MEEFSINVILGFFIGLALGIVSWVLLIVPEYESHKTLINKGYGQYNPVTSDFEFKQCGGE